MNGLNLSRGVQDTEVAHLVTEAHGGWSSGYLARVRLAGPRSKFDLDRVFVTPDEQSLSRAGNGSKTYYLCDLDDGVYEAESVYRSYSKHRVYFELREGRVHRRTGSTVDSPKAKDEAKVWLRERAAAVEADSTLERVRQIEVE